MGLYNTETKVERALLVGIHMQQQSQWEVEENISELADLTRSAGGYVVEAIIQERDRFDPSFLIGRGKAEEIAARIESEDISLVIFDDELSPAQIRNLEQLFEIKVIDRPALILEIFALRARSKEARTQVELAQLNYLLPRLTRQWSHLSRQVGGIGTKGPGETQLETDRRLVRIRIAYLNRELEKIERQRKVQQKQQQNFIRAALVGYTNAGKSTIMNALTNAETTVEDKLFATLDTTTRKMVLDNSLSLLLSDTVGFIRKLPHHLFASFRATLMQTVNADILLHIIDINNPMFEDHIHTVNYILQELNAFQIPTIYIFNKVDKVQSEGFLKQIKSKYPDAIFISAKKKIRLEKINERIYALIKDKFILQTIDLYYPNASTIKLIETIASVIDRIYEEQKIILKVRVSQENEPHLQKILENRILHENPS